MALTFTQNISSALRMEKLSGGLILKQVDVTLGVISNDYSAGVAVSANAGQFGMTRVWTVLDSTVRASSGTLKAYTDRYDQNTGKLRFYVPAIAATSAVNVALAEVVGSDHLANGDIVRMTVLGR